MPVYKGTLRRVDDGSDRRVPRRQRAAHPAGVRGRHRDDDGAKGAIMPVGRGDEGRRLQVRPEGLRAGGRRLLHRAERPDAVACRSTARRRSSTTTRTPSRPPASTRTSRRRPGRRWRWPPPSSRPAATSARSRPAGRAGPSSRASRPGTTCEFATKNNGFGGLDARLAFNSPLHVRHIENLANMAKQGLFVYKGRDNAADATFVVGRMRDDAPAPRRSTAASSATPSSPSASRTLPYYPDVAGRAAEHRHRRRQPVGDVGQEAGRVQGRGAVLQLPVQARGAGQEPPATPATCRSRLAAFELTEKSGFYKKNPGTDVAGDADDPQDHRQVARHPPRQLRADPHHHRRGDGAGLGRQEDAPRRRSTTPSSAATSSSSASRRPTSRPMAGRCAVDRPLQRSACAGAWKSASASELGWLPWALLAPQLAIIARLLLLAGRRRRCTAVVQHAGRVRHLRSSSSGWRTSARCSTTRPTSPRSGSPRSSRCWSPAWAWRSRCCWRCSPTA